MLSNKKKRTFHLVYFAVPANHRFNIKESKMIDNYLDHVWEQKRCKP